METNVHHPTDVNLLRDATRCLIREARAACTRFGVQGWRQGGHQHKKARKLFQAVNTARRWKARPDAVSAYLESCGKVVDKAKWSLGGLARAGASREDTREIRKFLRHAQTQIDLVRRRLLNNEVIPHGEKLFSVFEEHTRWICKGKAGRPVELGVPLCIVEDQHQFILGHMLQWQGGDTDCAVPLIESCQQAHPDLSACSFDRGFHSPANRARLDELLDTAALPKKGPLNAAEKAREAAPAFAKARRCHPAVESAINNLEQRGLGRVRTRGAEGFERTVCLSILAANLHRIGLILQKEERKRLARLRRRRRAA